MCAVFMRKTMEGVVEWAEKEVTHAQYRLQLLQRERDDNINFSIEVQTPPTEHIGTNTGQGTHWPSAGMTPHLLSSRDPQRA